MDRIVLDRFARLLARYSIHAGRDEAIAVSGTTAAEPLIEKLYGELLAAGARPILRMAPSSADEIFFARARSNHFQSPSPAELRIARSLHGSIGILSSVNTRTLATVNPSLSARLAKARMPLARIARGRKWTLALYPTQAYAQDAGMSLADFEAFVIRAVFLDRADPVAAWERQDRLQKALIARLGGTREIRIVGADTDLRMAVNGRRWISSVATRNVPSGEIFTGPVEESMEGHILYDYPVCRDGREIDGIRLVFRGGRVVEASATKNEAYLIAMLDSDPGARRVGELGIGMNGRIQSFIRNILFDEKIGGTIHIALGQAYPETLGRNRSALHWDMIKDLRRGGAIYADGGALQKDGRFLMP